MTKSDGNEAAHPRSLPRFESLDDLVSTSDAADACGVGKSTISMWVTRGYLAPSGLDERNRPLYRLIDVLRTARDTRLRAIGKNRIA